LDDADGSAAATLDLALHAQQPYTQRQARLLGAGEMQLAVADYTVTPLPATLGTAPAAPEQADTPGGQQLLVELHPLDRLIHNNREDSLFTTNQATRALVRGMAHEIKNPLGGIRGAAQLLERQLDSAELREYTAVIIHEADRLRALADRMLGARQPPAFARVNIHQILERVRRILQAEAGDAVQLVRDYDPSLPEVWADPDQLIQVFLNIMGNAVQCLLEMPPNQAADRLPPRVLIRSRVLRRFTIGTRCHALLCQVEIEDNGPGISTELRETVFYPMVTGRSQGTGLGLPIAQAIMQQHGGLIECESQPGQTIFKVLVPFPPTNDGTAPGDSHAQP
jgi:two-component system nitrogen regulation sensor histidine kinase GlnL